MSNLNDHIEKYLKGELSPAQMHELEMKALHDPFLADALEGATSIEPDSFESDVNAINLKINSKSSRKFFWPLRVAASILLIISVTYLIINSGPDSSNEQLALQKNDSAQKDLLPVISDSIEEPKEVTENLLSLKLEDKSLPKPTLKSKTSSAKTQPEEATQKDANETRAMNDDIQSEKDVLALSEEMEEATALVAERGDETDEILTESKTEPIRSRALKKSDAPTAVSGASSEKNKSAKQTSEVAKPGLSDDEYQQYLKANVLYPKEAIDNKTEGVVTISFVVDANGTLSNFTVDKGIGYGCDEELVRLIKEGPPWTPSVQSEKANVTFEFKIKN